jgi:hypothetical protein
MRAQMSTLQYGREWRVLRRGEARLLNLPYHSLKGAAAPKAGSIGTCVLRVLQELYS